MKHPITQWAGMALAAALLAACSSGVKLNDVPVEDKAGTTVDSGSAPANGQGTGSGTSQSGVTGVNLSQADAGRAGPKVERLVYFDYDSYVIKPEFQGIVDAHARHLKANRNSRVVIEGHTDERGGREYNLALGQKRAENVRRALALLGVPDGQLEAVSFGKEKPAAPGSDEAAWAKNRRAEISYR